MPKDGRICAAYESFKECMEQDKDSYAIFNPIYGVIPLFIANEALLKSDVIKQLLKPNFYEDRHFESAKHAQKYFSKPGIVACVIQFEVYVYQLMKATFDTYHEDDEIPKGPKHLHVRPCLDSIRNDMARFFKVKHLNDVIEEIVLTTRGWWLQFPAEEDNNGKHHHYKVVLPTAESVNTLTLLFYGIRCIMVHADSDVTTKTGVLKRDLTSVDMEVLSAYDNATETEVPLQGAEKQQAKELCQQYIVGLWQEVKIEKQEMTTDYFLYLNAHNFYRYLAHVLGRVSACILFHQNENTCKEKYFDLHVQEIRRINTKCGL